MADPVISVKGVSKKYRIGLAEKKAETFTQAVINGLKSPLTNLRNIRNLSKLDEKDDSIFWALKDISFDVNEGEVLGVIGHNGAGKSTLLKILSRITEPSTGEIRIKGRIAALLEVGTGFHPELTGRENIYMNATILGMRKREIDKKLDEIINFSGVEKYLDTPVKFYSSGMRVRLGFAVAAHLEPEILIIDEVLSVGDLEFQSKCLGKMENVAKQGRTVIFVSHDLGAVQSLCPRSILLSKGGLTDNGKSVEVINSYLIKSASNTDAQVFSNRFGNGNILIDSIRIVNERGDRLSEVLTGQKCFIEISYKSKFQEELPPFTYFHIFFKNQTGAKLFTLSSKYASATPSALKSFGIIRCCIDSIPLLAGNYYLDVCCKLSEDTEDYIYDAIKLMVISGTYSSYSRLPNITAGAFLVKQTWSSEL